ncbi:CIA30 family protein [Lacinutrix sp. WUR7]|nr:CIA30 family protein [Lacinutrix sp. WUR7]
MVYPDSTSNIFDFKSKEDTNNWYVINDGVMGGFSSSSLEIKPDGKALFKGHVTTENNGGFASVRYTFTKKEVSKFTYIVLRIKGDGKDYQFRIKEEQEQRHSYIAPFSTSGKWEVIKIPLSKFYPSFRGNTLDIPNFSGKSMEEIAFLIANKTKEFFQLEIESISLE